MPPEAEADQGRKIEAANKLRLERLLGTIVPSGAYHELGDYVREDVILPSDLAGGRNGLDAYREGLAASRKVIDYNHGIDDLIAEGDRVVARLTVTGRQIGPLMGLPNSGAAFSFQQIVIARFEDGRVAQFWRLADLNGLREQLETSPEKVD